jgi:outer membrane protein TolC
MKSIQLFWLAAIALPLGAQPLASLIDEALRSNREIIAAQKRYEAARQRPAQAASLPDPTVSLGYTSNGGPWPVAGIGRAATSNGGIMVSQEVPFPGKRELRGQVAEKEAGAEFQAYLAVRLSVVSRLKQDYHQLHHATVSIEFVKRYQELLENIMKTAEARYSVGRASQQDVFKAQTQFAVFETQLVRFEQERAAKVIQINALRNRPGDTPVEASDEMPPGLLAVTLDELLAGARSHSPELAREQKLVERGDAAANLSRKDYYPDYTLSGGYFNQGSMPPMWQFRVDFKLPAYFWNRQRAAVNEQAFTATEARRNYESTEVSLEARIREQYTVAQTARRLVELYEKSVIPGAQLALESSLAGYETGTLDFLAVFSNFMNVVDYELMDHEAIMQFHVAKAQLEELSGVEVDE